MCFHYSIEIPACLKNSNLDQAFHMSYSISIPANFYHVERVSGDHKSLPTIVFTTKLFNKPFQFPSKLREFFDGGDKAQ
jgi:hypothetical protein